MERALSQEGVQLLEVGQVVQGQGGGEETMVAELECEVG